MNAVDPQSAAAVASSGWLSDGRLLHVDGLPLTVRVSSSRSRLGLTVERDGALTIRVPTDCTLERAEGFVRANRDWIDTKVRLRDTRRPLHLVRELTDGEIHRYLGREYRLLIVSTRDEEATGDEPYEPVQLVAGHLRMDRAVTTGPDRGRRALATWYARRGQEWAEGRLQPWAARMEVEEPTVEVRDLGHNWGKYYPPSEGAERGRVALHWAAFQLPIHLVDYLIAHELAHMRISGHGPEYWRLLRRALPQCARWKSEMDEMGRRLWMGDMPPSQNRGSNS